MAEIAESLRLVGEGVEVVIGGLDFYDTPFGVLEQSGLGGAAFAFGLRKEAAVRQACPAVSELGGEEDGRV